MSKFILKPASLLQTRLVVSRTEPEVVLDFREMLKRFVPAGSPPFERMKLCNLKHGMFIGRTKSVRRPGQLTIFTLFNVDREGNVDFVLKQDASFEERFVEGFFVEKAEYDAKVSEIGRPQQKVA